MKKTYLILTCMLFLLQGIFSCDTNNNNELEPNFISMKINEENWNGVPEISMSSVNDTLTILGAGDEQVVVIKIKNNGKGIYNLSGAQASYYTTVGGDVITSLYTLNKSTPSKITITEYNAEENVLKGNFEISLLKKWSNPESNLNSLEFTSGQFKGVIRDQEGQLYNAV